MITTKTRSESSPRTAQCVECDTNFETTHSQSKYCSEQCRRIGHRRSWNKYGHANKEKRNRYHRLWYEINKVKRTAQIKEYQKSPKGKEVQRTTDTNTKIKYPQRYKARQKVLIAKRKGTLIPEPCSTCGELVTEAHHLDYNDPLNVKWLCNKHHREVHQSGMLGVFIQEGVITADNQTTVKQATTDEKPGARNKVPEMRAPNKV